MTFVAVAIGGSALIGGYQAIKGGQKQKQALNGLENLKTPTVAPSTPINNYYQEALSRYGVSPYNSRLYQMQKQNTLQNQATAIGAANDRRSGVGAIGALNGQTNNALQSAGVAAEQQNAQRFGQLGSAVNMRNQDDKSVFGINQMLPYQKQAQLYSLQAGAGGQQMNAGLQTINSAAGNAAEIATAKKMYGKNKYPGLNDNAGLGDNGNNTAYADAPPPDNSTISTPYNIYDPNQIRGL